MTDLVHVNGYSVRADFGDAEPRIQDLELARRLGFASPYDIRKIIRRHVRAGNLSHHGVFATVAKTSEKGGRPTTEYWLDEASALFVASQSGTDKGVAITKELISVFMAVRRGDLRRSTHPLLADTIAPWDAMFGPSLVESFCRLYGKPYTRRSPRFLASVFQRLYRLIADQACHAEMKARIPNPSHGRNLHQLLTSEARERFRLHLGIVEFTAKIAVSRKDFWQRLEASYANRPMQLPLGAA